MVPCYGIIFNVDLGRFIGGVYQVGAKSYISRLDSNYLLLSTARMKLFSTQLSEGARETLSLVEAAE